MWWKPSWVEGHQAQPCILSQLQIEMETWSKHRRGRSTSFLWCLGCFLLLVILTMVNFFWNENHKNMTWNKIQLPSAVVEALAFFSVMYESKVAHVSVEVDSSSFLVGHGTGKFIKPERIAAIQRENKPGVANGCFSKTSCCLIFCNRLYNVQQILQQLIEMWLFRTVSPEDTCMRRCVAKCSSKVSCILDLDKAQAHRRIDCVSHFDSTCFWCYGQARATSCRTWLWAGQILMYYKQVISCSFHQFARSAKKIHTSRTQHTSSAASLHDDEPARIQFHSFPGKGLWCFGKFRPWSCPHTTAGQGLKTLEWWECFQSRKATFYQHLSSGGFFRF